jgi:hypothetical protein
LKEGDTVCSDHRINGRSHPVSQQTPLTWIGGQGVSPQEQKTQQSPVLGFSAAPQLSQS